MVKRHKLCKSVIKLQGFRHYSSSPPPPPPPPLSVKLYKAEPEAPVALSQVTLPPGQTFLFENQTGDSDKRRIQLTMRSRSKQDRRLFFWAKFSFQKVFFIGFYYQKKTFLAFWDLPRDLRVVLLNLLTMHAPLLVWLLLSLLPLEVQARPVTQQNLHLPHR